jgi:hypothetical protein
MPSGSGLTVGGSIKYTGQAANGQDIRCSRCHLPSRLRGWVCVKTHLDQTTVTTLIKNLYPALRVPADVVVTIVGALGQGKGKPSPATQDSLVKWLRIVHEIIEDPSVLSRLYGVLFGMLDMISIRCTLLRTLSSHETY